MSYSYMILINNQGQWKNENIHDTVTKINTVSAWWHYLPNTYIVKTTSTSKQIADYLISNYPGLQFFITKVDLSDVNGVLAKSAWEWIEKEKRLKIKLVSRPSNPVFRTSGVGLLPSLPKNVFGKGTPIEELFKKK